VGRLNNALALSVFDVSDPANPLQRSAASFPHWLSEANWNHHAFNYDPHRRLISLPFQRWVSGIGTGPYFNMTEIHAFSLDARDQLSQLGFLSIPAGEKHRSYVIENELIALSERFTRGARITSLAEPLFSFEHP
jgi:hypothetical protein